MRPAALAIIVLAIVALIGGLLLSAAGGNGNGPTTEKDVTFTVESKERGSGEGENKKPALVWGTLEDGGEETFKVEDSLLSGSGNSADTYGRLREGEKYTCTARGYRSSHWYHTSYRNLMDCKPAKD